MTGVEMAVLEPEDPLAPLRAGPLADRVAEHIVGAIARRRLVSGQKLVEVELAEALGVSRVPIREATRILASQGIVVPTPRRGMRVANFDRAWGTQLHNARVAIERLAAHIVAQKLKTNGELLKLLLDRVADIEREVKYPRQGWFSINQADIAFHAAIFEIAESPLLSTLWSAIARHVLIMFAIETYRDTEFERIAAEHHTYVEALQSGNPVLLDKEIEDHVAGKQIFDREMQGQAESSAGQPD